MKNCDDCIIQQLDGTMKHFDKGSTLFVENDLLTSVFYIKSGVIKLEKVSVNGDIKIVDVITNNDFIGLISAIKGSKTYFVTAKTITPVTLFEIPKQECLSVYQNDLSFKEICLRCATSRITVFHDQVLNPVITDSDEIIWNALESLYPKFGFLKDQIRHIEMPLNKSDLASYIGLRRETVSRKLSMMEKQGIIGIDKNIYKLYGM